MAIDFGEVSTDRSDSRDVNSNTWLLRTALKAFSTVIITLALYGPLVLGLVYSGFVYFSPFEVVMLAVGIAGWIVYLWLDRENKKSNDQKFVDEIVVVS